MEKLNVSYSRKVRAIVNGIFSVILFVYFFNRAENFKSHLLKKSSVRSNSRWFYPINPINGSFSIDIIRRRTSEISDNSSLWENEYGSHRVLIGENVEFCVGLDEHEGYDTQCEYLKAHSECSTGGFFDYLQFFYCDCQRLGLLGYAVLGIWLSALFYLLGNTAADYFCFSLEKLSMILNLPPTVAGVTLLPFGNGASDVFASIAAFLGKGTSDVGLNSVLGGALFISCVVVGVVSLLVAGRKVQIDRMCFIRDLSFFFLAVFSLFWILAVGKVTVAGTVAYLMIYVLYAFAVGASEYWKKQTQRLKLDSVAPLLPVGADDDGMCNRKRENDTRVHSSMTQWMCSSNGAIYSDHALKLDGERPPWGWNVECGEDEKSLLSWNKLLYILELPLYIPRRLTIPMVREETWSKPYAVASATFAPILLVCLWSTRDNISPASLQIGYAIGVIVGCLLGILAYRHTDPDHPPERYLLPWVLGGFLMSIVWSYIIASELVALLVGVGVILGISPSILGLTVLAWGNSIGDLVSNVAFALNGEDGVQMAVSGCYAGPMFNTLIGLGMSLLLGAAASPGSYVLPDDSSLFYTLGFLLVGLIWAVVVLIWKDMQPTKLLGVGLLSLYSAFLIFGFGLYYKYDW